GASQIPCAEPAGVLGCLVSDCDLCCHRIVARNLGYAPRLVQGMRQWFLAKDMFASFHRRRRNGCMQVVRRAPHNGIDILLLFEQFTKVAVRRAATIATRTPL